MDFLNNLKSTVQSQDSIMMVILLVLLLSVLVYLILLYNRPSTKKFTIISVPTHLNRKTSGINEFKIINKSKEVPENISTERFAYSFWVYLNSVNNSNKDTLIFARTNDDLDVEPRIIVNNAHLLVYMRKETNSMIVKLKTKSSTQIDNGDNNLQTSIDEDTTNFLEYKIDYVPLQRWVHVLLNVNGKLTTLFLDGKAHSTNISPNMFSIKDPSGTVVIGGDSDLDVTDGLISRLEFFNYAFTNQGQVNGLYKNGPIKKNILQQLGITNYGVRSPLYRIDLENQNQENN